MEIRVTRYGRRARQLVVIPDADISEAEAESDDDADDPDYGTTLPQGNEDDESDLSSDDDDVPLVHLQRTQASADDDITDDDIPLARMIQANQPAPSKAGSKNAHNFRWRSMNPPVVDTAWKDVLPSGPDEVGTPISYFGQFFTPDMMQLIVEETNRYAVQNGSGFRISLPTLETYIGMLLRMGVVHMPRYRMYWSSDLRYNAIADYMSRNEFEDVGRFIHFNDNTKVITNRTDPGYDPLFKIRPLLDKLRQQCLLVAPMQRQSIDEQMIPFKGRNKLRQYLPNKPKRWGFKVMARCCSRTGFTHDFTVYEGKAPELAEGESVGYQPADFAILLCKSLPRQKNYIIYFDNWFNFQELQLRLKQWGFHSVGTLRANRVRGCKLKLESELRKEGRGSYDAKVDANSGLSIVRWFDNRAVQISSAHVGIEPVTMVKRWDNRARKFVEVPRPAAVTEYNTNMGGVDLFDMLAAMYRVDHKSRKWYRRLLYWALNVACVNGWILYRRHCSQLSVPKKDVLDLLGFVARISQCLIMINKRAPPLQRKRGRPSTEAAATDEEPEEETPRQKRAVQPTPLTEIRLDNVGHLPEHKSVKGRCRQCKTSIIRTSCIKCGVFLCLTTDKNCYIAYHTKP